MKMHRTLAMAVTTTAVLAGTAGPAHASTTFHSGPLTYTCDFPGPSVLDVTITEDFTGPDTVAPGAAFTLTNLSGHITLSDSALTAMTAAGFDGVENGRSYLVLIAANATSGTTGGAGTVDKTTWSPGAATIDFHGGREPFTAGPSGEITFRRPASLNLILTLHRRPGSTGPAGAAPTCRQQDGQDATFTPSLPIG